MDLYAMRREINIAKQTIRNADEVAGQIADFLPGRLRHVSGETLRQLKIELKKFNAHTFVWKDE